MPPRSKRVISMRLLRELWEKYTEFRRPQLAPSTVKRDYAKVSKRLQRIAKEKEPPKTAIEVRDWLLANYSTDTTRRMLIQLNACCKWAMYSELITQNPFEGLPSQVRSPRRSERQWAAFTKQERDRILQAFETEHPHFSPWVKWLFWTGSRPEEAAALRWKHVASDFQEVYICEAFPIDMDQPQSTKNYRTTRFPCNLRLQTLLRGQAETHGRGEEDFVIPSKSGGRFDYHNFESRCWRPLVQGLKRQGQIAVYLPQYNCRHTFITEGLKAGISVADMSYLCRVSIAVLHKHYLDRTRSITIPEF